MSLEWLAELSEEDRGRVIEESFSKVAQTEEGKIVFATIFEHLYFFRKAETPEQQALNNYAKFLIGLFGEDSEYRVLEALHGKEKT